MSSSINSIPFAPTGTVLRDKGVVKMKFKYSAKPPIRGGVTAFSTFYIL